MGNSEREFSVGAKVQESVSISKKKLSNNLATGIVKFAYFNARSVVNKLQELHMFLLEEKVDIVGITETWLTSNVQDSELQFAEFTLFRIDRHDKDKLRGGGVALYVRNELKPVRVLEIENEKFQESLWCKININGQSTTVGVCYRSPDSSASNDESLFMLLDRVSHGRVIVMGDFNYSILDWSSSDKIDVSHPFVECLGRNFLYQHVEEPSRGNNYLDLVISSDNIVEELTVGEPFESSDHQIIRFEVVVAKTVQENKKQKKRNYFKVDYNAMRQQAEAMNWKCIADTQNDSVDNLWCKIKGNLILLRDTYVKFKSQPKNKCKWVTKEARRTRVAKKKAWNDYIKSGRDSRLYELYKAKLKLSKSVNNKAKYNYEKYLADNIKNDTKSFYAYVNNKKVSSNKVGPMQDSQGNLVENNKVVANLLNNYFSSVFAVEDLNNVPKITLVNQLKETSRLSKLNIDKGVVLNKLVKLNVNKSHGPDEIHGKLLYELRHVLSEPLALLLQLSLHTGVVPQDWRDADVVPLHKKGSKSKCENYRPISLTSIVGKLLESVIKDEITSHLNNYNLLNESQHGFTSGKSCLTNLLDFFETVTNELDDGNDVDLIYLDFSKAFDKVPHKRLLLKLEAHGIGGEVGRWIENWLAGRRQRVVVESKFSEWSKVKSGVPQGSVLGPILFLIYINDLDKNIKSKINKFADDCKLGKPVSCKEDVEILRQDLKNLSKWAEDWQMNFNIEKCSVVHLGGKNSNNIYKINDCELKKGNVEKDLGVVVDKTMKFSEQCNNVVSSANATLGIIKRTITCKNKDIILRLYKALVRPKLEYCIQAWRPYLRKDIDKIEKVQRRATKMIQGYRNYSYLQRLQYTRLSTLEERRDRGDLIEVYKFVRGINKVDYRKFFTISNSNRTRGHKYKLVKSRSRLDIRKNFFSQRIVNNWNALPAEVVDAKSVNCFKKHYDKYMQDRH